MTAAPVWLLLATGLMLLGPARSRAGPVHARRRRVGPRRNLSPAVLRGYAALGAAVVCVAVAGPLPGLPAALLAAPAVAATVSKLSARRRRAAPGPGLPLALDLTAVALRSGQTTSAALELAAPVLPEDERHRWLRAAGLLALGADPVDAWAGLADGPLAGVALTARRSADSGVRLAAAFTRLAVEVRASARTAALQRAGRLAVSMCGPLGLCFLPAFVCLGIVPTVVGIAAGAIGGLR